MRAKRTLIELECPQLGIRERFCLPHASRLLGMRNNGGWRIPADSAYRYTGNGIVRRTDTEGDSRESQE